MNIEKKRIIYCIILLFINFVNIYSENIKGLNIEIFELLNGVWDTNNSKPRSVDETYSWGKDNSYRDGIIIDFGYARIEFNGLSYGYTIEDVNQLNDNIIEFSGYFTVYDARIEKIVNSPATIHIKTNSLSEMEFIEAEAGEYNFQLRFGDAPNIRIHEIEFVDKEIIISEETILMTLKRDEYIYSASIENTVKAHVIKSYDSKFFVLTENGDIGWINQDNVHFSNE